MFLLQLQRVEKSTLGKLGRAWSHRFCQTLWVKKKSFENIRYKGDISDIKHDLLIELARALRTTNDTFKSLKKVPIAKLLLHT